MEVVKKFISLKFQIHLIISGLVRFILILYGIYHDKYFEVSYTDIDYHVFTDASRYVINFESPFNRKTYRYSPILSWILVPNILINELFGKIVFSIVDLLVAFLIYKIVLHNLNAFYSVKNSKDVVSDENCKKIKSYIGYLCNLSVCVWLYNPLTIAISTRGNCDSLAGFFVLLTLYLIQCKKSCFLAGICHGFSIHFRLYPLAYSLTLYMFLSDFAYYIRPNLSKKCLPIDKKQTIFDKKYLLYLVPNKNQIFLVVGCILSLTFTIGIFYYLYGYTFLYETYIYHLVRKDTRHNFSLYFYMQYLTSLIKNVGVWQKVLVTLPQLILLIVLSFHYGMDRFSLNFAFLLETCVMVTYNTVLTSQYFVWIMVVLPLCVWQMNFTKKSIFYVAIIWFVAQLAWLLPAYLLEFRGQNTFFFIWLQSASFFCANIAILGRLIMYNKSFVSSINSLLKQD